MKFINDERGVIYAILVFLTAFFIFSYAFLITYNFIMVDIPDIWPSSPPQEVVDDIDAKWNLMPYVVFFSLSLWLGAYAIKKIGRFGR